MYSQRKQWEEIYGSGKQLNRMPMDSVVTFVYYNAPKDKPRSEVNILELGCGAGNNLWFAAREGFSVTGIDISQAGIDFAKNRFKDEGLQGEFIVGDFSCVAQLDKKFDLIIERGAMICIPFEQAKQVVRLLPNVMNPGARMLFCPYSDKHGWCASGKYAENGMVEDIDYAGVNYAIHFYGRHEIYELFKNNFEIESLTHIEKTQMLTDSYATFAEWNVVAKKI